MSCVERLQITGGVRLTGSVRINGAKNAILPLLAGSLLSEKSVVLEGVPSLIDVKTMKEALESLGVRVNWRGDTMQIDPSGISSLEVPPTLARRMRASNLVMGPLLGRCGRFKYLTLVVVLLVRPMDLHLKGFKAFGAVIEDNHGCIAAAAADFRERTFTLIFPVLVQLKIL